MKTLNVKIQTVEPIKRRVNSFLNLELSGYNVGDIIEFEGADGEKVYRKIHSIRFDGADKRVYRYCSYSLYDVDPKTGDRLLELKNGKLVDFDKYLDDKYNSLKGQFIGVNKYLIETQINRVLLGIIPLDSVGRLLKKEIKPYKR
jgi:hypothetical protein